MKPVLRSCCAATVLAFAAACSKGSASSSAAGAAPSGSAVAPPTAGASATTASGSVEGPHRYEVKSGILEMTNSMFDGMQETMYFDDYGGKQATSSRMDMKAFGQSIHSENVSIDADGYHIEYDAVKKTGTRRKLGVGMPAHAPAGAPPPVDVQKLTDDMKKQMKFETLPSKTIDGKVATGYGMEAMGMKVRAWTWKGLPLYSETSLGKKPIVIAAKSVKVDVPVPADKFVAPPDVKLTDLAM